MAPHSPYASTPRVRPSGAASQLDPSPRSSGAAMRESGDPSAAAPREHGLDGPEILLRVDADGGLGRLEHADRDALLEQSELLEALRALEVEGGRRWKTSSTGRR